MRGNHQAVLVTGGAGYIGSHACKALAQAGFQPVTYDNLVYGHVESVRWGPFEEGDILDRARLHDVIRLYNPVAIMHFAAFAYVGESVANPGKYYHNNVVGSLNLLGAARDHRIDKFVFSSSCATYGVPATVPISEDSPQQPINPYGASKLMVERMLADFGHAHGLRYATLRYFNAAGADAEGQIGEDHDPETHLIPLAIQAALSGSPELAIFGTDYLTPDGTAIRDYIHVTDLAEAHVLALTNLLSGRASMALNLGTGSGHTVRQVVDMVSAVTGQKVPLRLADRRVGDPPSLVANPSQAERVLNWRATRSDLRNIIQTAVQWYSANKNRV